MLTGVTRENDDGFLIFSRVRLIIINLFYRRIIA